MIFILYIQNNQQLTASPGMFSLDRTSEGCVWSQFFYVQLVDLKLLLSNASSQICQAIFLHSPGGLIKNRNGILSLYIVSLGSYIFPFLLNFSFTDRLEDGHSDQIVSTGADRWVDVILVKSLTVATVNSDTIFSHEQQLFFTSISSLSSPMGTPRCAPPLQSVIQIRYRI